MSRRIGANAVLAAVAAASALAVAAPPASAEFTSYAILIGPSQDGLGVDIFFDLTTDSAPISCKWSAKDLDQFGKVNAGARIYNSTTASLDVSYGPYALGHRVQVDVTCRDRSGATIGDAGVFTIVGAPD